MPLNDAHFGEFYKSNKQKLKMALTILPEIAGQQVNENVSYCYLYEPLRVNVFESTPATKLYIDIVLLDLATRAVKETFFQYVDFDINPLQSISFDLMEITRQLEGSDVYKIGNFQNLLESNKTMITSSFIYLYKIYSSETASPSLVYKLPILGGREFKDFIPQVAENQVLNEFELYGVDIYLLAKRWGGYSFIKTALAKLSSTDLTPINTEIKDTILDLPSGGVVHWKSRFGGWMHWGFEMSEKKYSNSYEGNLNVGMFDSTSRTNGNPFIPVDYTGISSSYSIDLKSFSLITSELMAVSGISSSIVAYYQETNISKLELMRISSVSVPLKNLADGGDFSLSLQSISKTNQKSK